MRRGATLFLFVLALALLAPAPARAQGPWPPGSYPAGSHLLDPGRSYTLAYPSRDGYTLWIEGPRGCLVWGTSLGDVTTIRAPLANPLTVEDRSGLLSCPVTIWYVPTTLCRGPACPEQPAADAARAAGAGLPAGADLSRTLRDVLNMPLVGWILAIVGGGLLGYAWLRSLMDFIRPLLWRPDETIDEEWDLYEHLENEGLDKETASRIASNWRHRDDDE